jgi:hypothetical protein
MNLYVHEKIRELEEQRMRALTARQLAVQPQSEPHPQFVPRRRRPVFGTLARQAGRTLRRWGEGLESWSAPPGGEPKQPLGLEER